jgi:hypothetical protein
MEDMSTATESSDSSYKSELRDKVFEANVNSAALMAMGLGGFALMNVLLPNNDCIANLVGAFAVPTLFSCAVQIESRWRLWKYLSSGDSE